MARPTNKSELLKQGKQNYERLMSLIESKNEKEQNLEFESLTLNRNIRDVLAHLHHWHLMLLSWYEEGMVGDKPKMPADGYTWRTLPALNIEINRKYENTPLKKVKMMLEKSYKHVREIIDRNDDASLFLNKKYPWTGSTSMGAYFISATSSHYDWAYKLIKKSQKTAK